MAIEPDHDGVQEQLVQEAQESHEQGDENQIMDDENNLQEGFKTKMNLIEEDEFSCLLFFKRMDLFLLKPWLIYDFEKRQVRWHYLDASNFARKTEM